MTSAIRLWITAVKARGWHSSRLLIHFLEPEVTIFGREGGAREEILIGLMNILITINQSLNAHSFPESHYSAIQLTKPSPGINTFQLIFNFQGT